MLFFTENLEFFRFFRFFSFFSVFFGLFPNSLFRLFRFYTETESFDVSIELKQTGDPPKQFKREYIWVFFWTFRVVKVCFGLLRNSSVCFGCFDIDSKHRNKPKFLVFGFTKQTETNAKQILFRFVSVQTEINFCLFRGHPTPKYSIGAVLNFFEKKSRRYSRMNVYQWCQRHRRRAVQRCQQHWRKTYRWCSAQTQTGIGLLEKPPAE